MDRHELKLMGSECSRKIADKKRSLEILTVYYLNHNRFTAVPC